jgi:hypothetical protein
VGLPPLAAGSKTRMARTSLAWVAERLAIDTSMSSDADTAGE